MFLFLIATAFIVFHMVLGLKTHLKKNLNLSDLKKTKTYKGLSLLIPCYNEEVVLKAALDSLKDSSYPNLEIVLINDGSSDRTLDILKEELKLVRVFNRHGKFKSKSIIATYKSTLYDNMFVIDKDNGGKADSLNAGMNFASKEYVVTLDADSVLREDSLYHINYTLQDTDVIAVGGNVVVSQGIKNYDGEVINCNSKGSFLEFAQFIEYLRGFFILKNSYAHLNALSVISGAFGVFNKNVMAAVGGFSDTVGEDIDITIKFNRYAIENNKKIKYNDQAMCFTEVPNNWSDLKKQRVRWQKAFLDAIKNHFGFIVRSSFKNSLAFFMLVENFVFMYATTIITIVGMAFLAISVIQGYKLDVKVYLIFTIGTIVFLAYNIITFKIAISSKIALDDIKFSKLISLLAYEFLFYRPLSILIILYGTVEYFFNPGGWNKVQRIGVSNPNKNFEDKAA